jgi:hypothetical protein
VIIRNWLSVLVLLLVASQVCAQNRQSERAELQGIDDQVQTLKKEVIAINKELSLLEEKLLFPSTTQMAVFLSLQSKRNFRLDAVELSVDGRQVAKYIYTFRELEALQKGGVQRLHTGNISTGGHKLAVVIRGQTAAGKSFEKTASTAIDKKVTPKFVEMQIVAGGGEPRISFKDW